MTQYQFGCDQCGKGFTHRNNWLQHKEEHIAPTDSQGRPKSLAQKQPEDKSQDNKVYKHKKFQFQFNFSDTHICDQCEKVFESKDKIDEHMVEHRPAQEQVKVTIQPARVVCDCRFPCVPIRTYKAHVGVKAQEIAPSGLDNSKQQVRSDTPKFKEGTGEQEKVQDVHQENTWQVAGGAGRFKCHIVGKPETQRVK